ncbi:MULTISPECIES: hypothetical protein [unclassified Bradyrhizobium]|uniref:hypothetical protein n=1 Tax=unclassified Bradyrhizobium TaxID=2631580 RepID=UPI00247A126A|nr:MULTISPECIES: hypothetical protein [unclassified Bradyrhizobium]WGS17368.1 hypothetical protein MTX22_22130 [Bradyrhizobium sp. ISRA463]WGS24137.1 hypothetical protein MTX19_19800 [Bradyrhizobium sp. ISRA464]
MLAGTSVSMRCIAASVVVLVGAALSGPAFAYRPFDGTDAAVAAPGELEVELQPAGVQHEQGTHTLIAPWTVLNIGLGEGWEAVFEGRGETTLSPAGPTELIDAGAFLKHVVVPGSLQDKVGPSVATEFGVLLPDSTGNSGVGASWAGIVSQRWDWGTVHFNVETLLTREHRADVLVGSIIEGPSSWKVRPVAEVFYEKEFGLEETVSGLVGLIWQVNDKLSFDVAYRHALTNRHAVNEIRGGLTFAVPIRFEGARNR